MKKTKFGAEMARTEDARDSVSRVRARSSGYHNAIEVSQRLQSFLAITEHASTDLVQNDVGGDDGPFSP